MKKKKCPKCGKTKLLSGFHKDKSRADGLNWWCKDCLTIYRKKYYNENREAILKKVKKNYKNNPTFREKRREYSLKINHGLTTKQYNKILKMQNYKCRICGKHQKNENRHLAVDHNHKTKFIRGILCTYCNSRLLRYLHDNKKRAIGLIKYLQNAVDNDRGWK